MRRFTERRPRPVLGAVAGAVMVVAIGALLGLGPRPATAQVESAGSLSLTGQTTFVRPGGFFDLELRVAGAGVRHTITVEVYPAVESRIEFLDGLRAGADLGEPILRVDAGPIAELQPANTDLISVRIRTSPPDDPRPDTVITDGGVHPVRVVLSQRDAEPVDEVVTHLLALPTDGDAPQPLSVAFVVPVDPPVARGPDQELDVDPESRAIIDNWVEVLRVHQDTPVTFRVPGEYIEALFRSGNDDDTASLEALQSVLGEAQTFLSETFVPLEHETWRDTSVDQYPNELRRVARTALDEHLAPVTIDDHTHHVTSTDTGETLLWLQEQTTDRVLISPERLEPLDPDTFPLTVTQPFVLEHADGAIDAVATDTVLSAHIGASGSPVLDAQRLLADLTVLAMDAPATSRAAVLETPPDLVVDPTLLTTLLNGIERSPLLDAVTLDHVFDDIELANAGGNGPGAELGGFPLVRRLDQADDAPSLGVFPAQLIAARQDLASFESVVGENGPLTAPLRDLLLVVGAAEFDHQDRQAYLEAVRTELARSNNAVRTQTEQSVSLTARQADVPVLLVNDLGVTAQVHLVLQSDKLDFPDGDRLEIMLEPGTSTVEIPVRARTSGDAVLEITARSPDDRLRLGEPAQVTVRSTVLSGLGVIISVVALAVLITWWARQVWRRRHA